MNNLQATKAAPANKLKSRLLTLFLTLNFLAIIVTFTLNFLGLPVLKYHYLVHVGLTIAAVLFFEFPQILPFILTLYFLEGQGRILWEYANWARIIFDVLVFLSIMKLFIIKKKVIDLEKIPPFLIFLIALHFFWYIVEFSNPYSVSYLASIAATKVYIYPILLFLGLTQIDFDIYQSNFQKSLTFFILLIVLEISLSFYQFNMKEQFILQIAPYYNNAMRDGVFVGMLFRPFGTTQLPGAISSFLFLTVGFLFLKNVSRIGYLLRAVLISASGFVIILCQVRSAFIKFLLIIAAIHVGELLYFRFRAKGFVGLIIVGAILLIGAQFVTNNKSTTGDVNIDYVRDRISSLGDVHKIKGSRINVDTFMKIISSKLVDYPLGLGPGLTGPAGSMSKDALIGNRFVNTSMVWTSDNILIALIIDFGFGAIFYILMLLYIPIYFIRFLAIYYRTKAYRPYKILLICLSTTLVILIGNWGALGITYNPESFAFWFFSALGFSTIAKYKKGDYIEAI